MPGIPVEMVSLLKDLYAFRSLSDQEVNRIAAMAELVELDQEAQLIVPEGEYAPFYMVISGKVSLQEDRSGSSGVDPFPYKAGQFFGADKLLYERNRRLTAKAVVPTRLLELSSGDLKSLLLEIPGLKAGLLFAAQMKEWLRDKAFRWIGDEELVYLISRKHPYFPAYPDDPSGAGDPGGLHAVQFELCFDGIFLSIGIVLVWDCLVFVRGWLGNLAVYRLGK
jgi:hypothetical protein